MIVYLDCNATTPIEPKVRDIVLNYMETDFGNSGSRTHSFGTSAKKAVGVARKQVGALVSASSDEVIFTSGATESNNIALLGLEHYGNKTGRRHIISTQIEHKATLEPLEYLAQRGFEVELLPVASCGYVEPDDVKSALRPETLMVSVMHVNNETGIIQPLDAIAKKLANHQAYFHTDAAQGYGKEFGELKNPRIDLISISGHKLFAPKGMGALITRKRKYNRVPLKPLSFGGGQERKLRPGTLPVPLIAGLGLAADLAARNEEPRRQACLRFRHQVLEKLASFNPVINGDPDRSVPHTLNLCFPGIDSEALMLTVKNHIAISNGSACTSQDYTPSHVLQAMGFTDEHIACSVRLSWCHLTRTPDWASVIQSIRLLCG